MNNKYSVKEDAFDYFMKGTLHDLKSEISKSRLYILRARKQPFIYPAQQRSYDEQYNRWRSLELIEQLKCNLITRDIFDLKVIIDKGIPCD